MKKIVILFILVLILNLFLVNASKLDSVREFLDEKTPAYLQKITGFEKIEELYDSFARGFLAAFLIWVIYTIIKLLRKLRNKDPEGSDNEEYSEKQTKWMNIVAGRLWKVPVVAMIFMIIMTIPVVNVVVWVLLLNFWIENPYLQIFMLAFWIGFLPSLIENFWKEVYVNKLKKKVWDAQKIGAITKIQAETE